MTTPPHASVNCGPRPQLVIIQHGDWYYVAEEQVGVTYGGRRVYTLLSPPFASRLTAQRYADDREQINLL